MTNIWLAIGHSALNSASMACGAMYLPPEVLMRSFFRSVIRSRPMASSSPTSPVANQPSASSTSAVCSGQSVVAPHDPAAAEQDLAVVGDLDLGPLKGSPTVPNETRPGS